MTCICGTVGRACNRLRFMQLHLRCLSQALYWRPDGSYEYNGNIAVQPLKRGRRTTFATNQGAKRRKQ
eukprot:1621759-Amphidinium_carterae.1